ncbi:glutathione S-transferase L2, chloroplastic-like, partial [Camellia sinensis]|uniref:glutathione S-transferase L2, chloroplastic-like n=1 Tax=Camellia sinensis TaxID=4442 RepID=UPI00103636DD
AFVEELLSYINTFNLAVITSLKGGSENEISTAFDYLESALFKFTDGPFFLGQFSLVDIAYAPFIERFYPLLLDVKKYDITTGRPMLTSWIEVHYLSLPFCAELLLCGCQPTSNSNSNW